MKVAKNSSSTPPLSISPSLLVVRRSRPQAPVLLTSIDLSRLCLQGADGALLLLLALVGHFVAETTANKLGETCLLDRNCDAGLHCETCVADGNIRPRCTRVKPTDPQTKGRGLPFNRYSWLTTHNSFARLGERSATGAIVLAPTNQQDTVTAQLNNGVRGLMLDMYDFQNDVWLCHSFGGVCHNVTSFVSISPQGGWHMGLL